jgi:hypothetical protein
VEVAGCSALRRNPRSASAASVTMPRPAPRPASAREHAAVPSVRFWGSRDLAAASDAESVFGVGASAGGCRADGGTMRSAAAGTGRPSVALQAKTTVSGVPAGTNAEFRFRALTKEGQADWSQPAALLVK